MRAVGPITEVLERIYAPEPDHREWLEAIRAAAARAFDRHAGAQTYVMRPDRDGAMLVAADEPWRSAMLATMANASAEQLRPYFAGARVRTLPTRARGFEPGRDAGIARIVCALGFAEPEEACGLSFVITDPSGRLTRRARFALERLSAHLGASWRLRTRGAPDEAVLGTNGAVLHAQGAAKEAGSRKRLREAAIGIARAKRERDPLSGLAFWTAMVEGRWTLVERFDADGKRLLLAKRNAPETIVHGALTEKERLVVDRASRGGSQRLVAYELGLPESTVSETLARAMAKLGVRDRAELVEVYASLCGAGGH